MPTVEVETLHSRQLRILTIIGTRPEAIKMAPVIRAIRADERFEHVLAVTGQHREMVAPALDVFGLNAQLDLDLMEHDQSLAGFAARALAACAEAIDRLKPDAVLVQGDTSTAMVASLAAFYAHVSVGHVEAGLRTGDRDNPFPEEINRRLIGTLATWHFAPTYRARENLRSEGVVDLAIHVTGNTIVDAMLTIDLPTTTSLLDKIPASRRIVLATAHRRESIGERMRAIFRAFRRVAESSPDVDIILPVHPNPNVEQIARAELSSVASIHLVAPMHYRELLATLKRSVMVLTDSGGIQEEAPSFNVPVLVLRDATERPELIESHAGILVGTDEDRIANEAIRLLRDPAELASMRAAANPFGDGRASDRIVDILSRAMIAVQPK